MDAAVKNDQMIANAEEEQLPVQDGDQNSTLQLWSTKSINNKRPLESIIDIDLTASPLKKNKGYVRPDTITLETLYQQLQDMRKKTTSTMIP